MDITGTELSDYAKLIQKGLALANRQLMERDALLGQTLILGAPDGSWSEVRAKELLEKSKKSSWWRDNFSE